MRVNIEFGGFYGSVHELLVEASVEAYCTKDDGSLDEAMHNEWDWSDSFNGYMLAYVQAFENWLSDRFGIKADFYKCKLVSPREYNFRTDSIEADITDEANKALIEKFKDDADFLNYLAESTKHRSGFVSFYTFDEALANKDNVLIEYLLRYLCEEFNDDDLDSYIDRVQYYDMI